MSEVKVVNSIGGSLLIEIPRDKLITNINADVNDAYVALTKEEASSLAQQLEAHLQDMEVEGQSLCCSCGEVCEEPGSHCNVCSDLIAEAAQNDLDGLCSHCKGSCTNMDGTECDECEGMGVV